MCNLSDTINVILNGPALQVDVEHVRAGFMWLLGHNWEWIEATKNLNVVSFLAEMLQSYRESLMSPDGARGSERGVPAPLVANATKVSRDDVDVHLPGPADAGDASSDTSEVDVDAHQHPKPKKGRGARVVGAVDSSVAVLQSNASDLGPAQLVHVAMEQYGLLQKCQREYMQADSVGDDEDKKRLIREEAVAVANALRALKALNSNEARAKLQYFYDITEGKPNTVRISHGKDPLNTWDPNWWVLALTDLFYTGDFVVQTKVGGLRRWAKVLLSRVDYLGWSASKEFAVAAYNICQRRRQMWAVYRFVHSDTQFNRLAKDISTLKAADFLDAALQEGDFDCVKKALRKRNLNAPVKSVLQSIQVALRDVEGSEAERESFRLKLGALRLWNDPHFLHSQSS